MWPLYRESVALMLEALRIGLVEVGLSLSDHAVLEALDQAPLDGIRSAELAARLRWRRSRLSHQIVRMQARGLVTRASCAADGRGALVSVSPCGAAVRSRATEVRDDVLHELFIRTLSAEQLVAARDVAETLIRRLTGSLPSLERPLPRTP